jgi:hypothetical protein
MSRAVDARHGPFFFELDGFGGLESASCWMLGSMP